MGMREIAPFGLRMPAELKQRLLDAARANGRSLNTEAISRLAASLEERPPLRVGDVETPAYQPERKITDLDRQMLGIFDRWSNEKKLAFLSLFG